MSEVEGLFLQEKGPGGAAAWQPAGLTGQAVSELAPQLN